MKAPFIFSRLISSLLVLGLSVGSVLSADLTDPFMKEFSFMTELSSLREQRIVVVGKEQLVQAYEKFINKHSRDPNVNRAMIDLGSLYETTVPEARIQPDQVLALKWFRNAAKAATPGSKAWFVNQQYLLARLADPAEKRPIIEELALHAKNKLAIQVQIEKNLMDVCVLERDYATAAVHCRRIMHWHDDPARVPQDMLVKSEIDSFRRNSADEYIMRVAEARSLPKAERNKIIEEFASEFDFNQDVYLGSLDIARKHSQERRE
jgi:hypothetical protein